MRIRPIGRIGVVFAVGSALVGPIPADSADSAPTEPATVATTAARTPAPAGEAFPSYEFLEAHVRFWRDVFARYRQSEVVVHDYDHPGLVYEVVPLPGELGESYTDAQQEFADDLRERWEDRLRDLARRVRSGTPAEADRELLSRIDEVAGRDALAKLHERVRTQRGLRERFRRGLEIGARYDAWLREVFRDAGLPEDLALLPHVESSFQSRARSAAGALGAWQFTRGTGRQYLTINSLVDERLDPVLAAHGAARYLAHAYATLGSWPLALTAYNHGVHGMRRASQRYGRDYKRIWHEYEGRTFGFASRNFYAEFLAAREIAKDPDHFFPEGWDPEPRLNLPWVELERPTSPGRLARRYGVPVEELAALNPAWKPRTVRRGLAIPAGLRVWLPDGASHRAGGRASGPDTVYVVQRGDSLWAIADAYGLTLEQLRALNGLDPRVSRIHPGQRLRVAEEGGDAGDLVHVVRRGDTLSEIALAYGVTLASLLNVNRLTSLAVIHPGQEIRIPVLR